MTEERWQRLLAIGAREFATAGYEAASLNRIIRTAGLSKSSFYHFIGSKEALFDAVVREAAGALLRDLDVPDPGQLVGPDFWEHIAQLGRKLAALSTSEHWYVDLGRLFYLPDAPTGVGSELGTARAAIDAWMRTALNAGKASGAIRSDLPDSLLAELTMSLLATLDSWSLRHLPELDPEESSRLANAQVDLIRRMLAPR